MKKKGIAAMLVVVMLMANGVAVSAESKPGSVGEMKFTAYSSISANGADAGTVSDKAKLSMSVNANYKYTYIYTQGDAIVNKSANGSPAAVVSFSAPANCRSVSITASHSASDGTDTWTGSTSAVY